MVFKTIGNKSNPVILFFHAMGVIGESSMPVAEKMKEKYYCIMPTSTVYCAGQEYRSKTDEIQQILKFLKEKEIKKNYKNDILKLLSKEILTKEELSIKTNKNISEINQELTILELEGIITEEYRERIQNN